MSISFNKKTRFENKFYTDGELKRLFVLTFFPPFDKIVKNDGGVL